MSEDLKAKFRAAAAQRGLPSAKDQLKAIKAQKAAMAAAAGPGPSSQRLQQEQQPQRGQTLQQKATPGAAAAVPMRAAGAGALPADFFQQAPKAPLPSAPVSTTARPGPSSTATAAAAGPSSQALAQQPRGAGGSTTGGGKGHGAAAGAAAAAGGAAAAGPGSAALPEGFFSDKAADAKARGVKLPTAADKEAEFRAFTALIDEELKQQAAEEAEEAEVEAEEKADREAFLLRRQQERLELLRQRKALLLSKAGPGGTAGVETVYGNGGQLPELPLDDELREAPPPAFGMSSDEGTDAEGEAGVGAAAAAGRTGAVEASGSGAGEEQRQWQQRRRRTVPMLPSKRRRVIDALAATLAAAGEEEGSGGSSGHEGSEGEGGAGALNWRAKRV